ncbi:hypothetical protein WN943_026832 [Citrus x changshan-huyou]
MGGLRSRPVTIDSGGDLPLILELLRGNKSVAVPEVPATQTLFLCFCVIESCCTGDSACHPKTLFLCFTTCCCLTYTFSVFLADMETSTATMKSDCDLQDAFNKLWEKKYTWAMFIIKTELDDLFRDINNLTFAWR